MRIADYIKKFLPYAIVKPFAISGVLVIVGAIAYFAFPEWLGTWNALSVVIPGGLFILLFLSSLVYAQYKMYDAKDKELAQLRERLEADVEIEPELLVPESWMDKNVWQSQCCVRLTNKGVTQATGVYAEIVRIEPTPDGPTWEKARLQVRHDNVAPYTKSQGFTLAPGDHEDIAVAHYNGGAEDMRVYHTISGVERNLHTVPTPTITIRFRADQMEPREMRISLVTKNNTFDVTCSR